MRTIDDVERYLGLVNRPCEAVGRGTWVVKLEPGEVPLVVRFEPPILVLRMKIMPLPQKRREEFLLTLLKMNATEVVHGAYGVEDEDVVLACALEVENLDPNEVHAAIDSIEMAWAGHRETLAAFAQ